MKVEYTRGFIRDLRRLRSHDLRGRAERVIESLENATSLVEVSGTVRIKGPSSHYRVRVGDYRLGLAIEDDTVILVRFLHRREIYRHFP